jgi:hypothetical protein
LADVEDDLFLPNSDIGVGDELEFETTLVTIEEGLHITWAAVDRAEMRSTKQDLTPLYQWKQDRAKSNEKVSSVVTASHVRNWCRIINLDGQAGYRETLHLKSLLHKRLMQPTFLGFIHIECQEGPENRIRSYVCTVHTSVLGTYILLYIR